MATKNTTKKTADEKPEVEEVSEAAEEVDRELSDEELLADLPALRPPHRLRLRHKNRIMGLFLKARREGLLEKLEGGDDKEKDDLSTLEPVFKLLEDVDDFAESIAEDEEAYIAWAEANSDNYPAYMAIMNRYVSAVGESKSSAS